MRTVDFNKKSFECGGRRFKVQDSLSFEYYKELQKINLEFGFGATFEDIFKNIRLAWDHLNGLRLGEAAVVLHNVMYGIIQLDDKDDPALRICALFIIEDGEDTSVYNEGVIRSKIDCWAKELDVTPFFHLASSVVPGWMPAYKIVSQSGLSPDKEEVSQSETK